MSEDLTLALQVGQRICWDETHGYVMGADMDGEDYASVDFDLPCALVIGNEGKGIGTLTAKKCDRIISLPMLGKINSLNASVAAGVLMYAVVNKRRAK